MSVYIRVYPRDASWHNHPNVSSPKKLHRDRGDGFAVCSKRIMLNTDLPTPLALAATAVLCKRCIRDEESSNE